MHESLLQVEYAEQLVERAAEEDPELLEREAEPEIVDMAERDDDDDDLARDDDDDDLDRDDDDDDLYGRLVEATAMGTVRTPSLVLLSREAK